MEKTLAEMAHGNSGFLMVYIVLYQVPGNQECLKNEKPD